MKRRALPALFLAVVFLTAVSACPAGKDAEGAEAVEAEVLTAPADPPLAFIKPGLSPLWFEFTAGGPALIPSPEKASLAAFVPWPLARMATALLIREDLLLVLVNREGFLAFLPRRGPDSGSGAAGDLALYHRPVSAWASYTAAALFVYRETPAALLYRDDFFIDSPDPAPLPRVWGIAFPGGNPAGPAGLEIPAFAAFPPSENWDVDALRRGRDGLWYFRAVLRTGAEPVKRYFRAADLAYPPEASSAGAFRTALQPFPFTEAPSPVRALLDAAFRGEKPYTLTLAAPAFGGSRQFSPENGEEGAMLIGFYVEEGGNSLAVITDGTRGGVGRETPAASGSSFMWKPFSPPPLPEGFVYTGMGRAGPALVALWEEQQDSSVGAAGFMVMALP
jgi:hypothetical protein